MTERLNSRLRRLPRTVLALSAAAATVLCAPASPAGAHGGAVKGNGGVYVGPGGVAVYWCAAIATEPASSTSIDRCDLHTDDGLVASAPAISMPGQAAMVSGIVAAQPTAALWVCWSVSARTLHGHGVTDEGCSARGLVTAS